MKIPATIITGSLGAGKTTLIRHLLETANGRRLALVINEFGDIGIDGEILRACGIEGCSDDDIVELANGCICCTVADEFLPTIEALLERPKPPDHIVIETSGLALPKPLVQAFNWPEIRTRVTVDGVVAVIDGPAVAAGRFAEDPAEVQRRRELDPALEHDDPLEEVFEDQIQCADMVLVNKCDLLDAAVLEDVRNKIESKIRSAVKVVPTRFGTVDSAVLLGIDAAAEDDLANRPSIHDDLEEHDHDDFESFVVELDALEAPDDLLSCLADAIARHDILRVKGFAAIAGRDMRLVIQAVGNRVQSYYDREWEAGESRRTRLVVIGLQGMDRAAIGAEIAG